MTFNPADYGAVRANTTKGTFNPADYGAVRGQAATQPPPQQNQPSLADSIWSSLASYGDAVKGAAKSGIDSMSQGFQQAQNSNGNPIDAIESGLKVGAGAIGAATSGIAPLFSPLSNLISNPPKGSLANKITESPTFQDFANSPQGQGTARVAEDVGQLSTIAGAGAGMVAAPKVPGAINDAVQGFKNIKYTPAEPPPYTPPPLNRGAISDLYNRAIRPTVAGKSTAAQVAQARDRTVSGLQAIHDNKSNLSFTNADGEITTNTTPKSVDQLTQAIGQTKSAIFKQYDALAKQAGESGVAVDASTIATELQPVIESKSLAIANPKAIEYAKALQERLTSTGKIDAQTAQDVIEHYNASLKAFYRSPSYDTASQASIDAMIANKFREQLDAGISGATGAQYQVLKNQYGALASMEKDVAHRNIVWGRQNNVGLAGNIANISSAAELIRGLATLNPVDLAVGTGIKGVQLYMKYLNNPDVGVQKIFSEIGKSSPPSKGSTLGQGAGDTTGKPYSQSSTNPNEVQVNPPKVQGGTPNMPTSALQDPLTTEAQKYSSAEEFVKAQTNSYHGTPNKEFSQFEFGKSSNTENETNGLGVWTTPQEGAAKTFSNKIEGGLFGHGSTLKDVGGTVMPVRVNLKNPKVYESTKGMDSLLADIEKLQKDKPSLTALHFTSDPIERNNIISKRDAANTEIEKLQRQYQRDAFEHFMDDRDKFASYINKGAKWEDKYIALDVPKTNKAFIEYLKAQGHDGIIIKGTKYDAKGTGHETIDQTVTFDPKNVLTKSQLTDIWNKAKGKTTPK